MTALIHRHLRARLDPYTVAVMHRRAIDQETGLTWRETVELEVENDGPPYDRLVYLWHRTMDAVEGGGR